ncbi:MAG: hypothetical protein ABIH46_03610 [Chloroflexota bacterium]
MPKFRLPFLHRLAHIVAVAVGIVMIGIVVSVSALFFIPYVLDPLLTVGPLKPYAILVRFLWEYGLVLLPFLGMAVMILLVPTLRRRATEIVLKGLVWIGLATWGIILATIIFWTVPRVVGRLASW